MPLDPPEIERCRRFVRQADSVFSSTLVQRQELSTSFTLNFEPGELRIQATYGDSDPLESLANRIRVFTLERDGIRFDHIHAVVARDVTSPGGLEMLEQAERQWAQAAIRSDGWSYSWNGRRFTAKESFDIWYYGCVAHANADKIDEFDQINGDSIARHMLRLKVQEFCTGVLPPIDTLSMFCRHLVERGTEPNYVFRLGEDGVVMSVDLRDGTAVPTQDFPYEEYGLPTPAA